MKPRYINTVLCLLALFVCSLLDWSQMHGQTAAASDEKPIVALVQRTRGQLTFKIHPDPAPGKDPLFAFNMLLDKLGPHYPVVAIVQDCAKVSDLYQVSGIAAEAGFDSVRTFISNQSNGMMFEVKFGSAVPFSVKGRFDSESPSPK